MINTITGTEGHNLTYVSVKDIVADEGALLAPPTVTTRDGKYMAIDDVAVTASGDINGVRYDVGELITFNVAVVVKANRTNSVDVHFETADRKQTSRFLINQRVSKLEGVVSGT